MGELYGISKSDVLGPDDRDRLARLGREFRLFRQTRAETQEAFWAAVSAISLHPNDPMIVRKRDHPRSYCMWIGNFPDGDDRAELPGLVQSLRNGDVDFLQGYDPPFAACVLDSDGRTLWLIADPYGLHPIYYALQNGLLSFCTKLSPLLRSGAVSWQLDKQALLDFFTYEHVTGDRTFADSVRVLPPGAILRFAGGRIQIRSYRKREVPEFVGRSSVRETADRLYHELTSAVARSLSSARRVAVTLSGGLDSRALLGCATEEGADVRTYTFGLPGCRDVAYARQLARACDVPHTVVEVDGSHLPRWLEHGIYVTGGMVNCIHFHILSLGEVLGAEADVVLDGLGGDALTGGHLKWGMVLSKSPDKVVDIVYRQRGTGWATFEGRTEVFDPDFLAGADYDPKEAVREHFKELPGNDAWRGAHRFDLVERQRRFIQYGPHLLRPLVDVRTPFYSPRVVSLMAAAPPLQLLEQRCYLLMHSRYLPRVAEVPDSLRGVPITWPLCARFGKKVADFLGRRLPEPLKGFRPRRPNSPTDYALWFRTTLRAFLEERLLDNHAAFEGIIQRSTIERIVREHREGTADHTIRLGCFLTLAAWAQSIRA